MLSKGEYIGHLENINEVETLQPHENSDAYTTSSVTTKRMMSEQVELDVWTTMPQTQAKHQNQAWRTFKRIWITVCMRWNLYWNNTPHRDVHRHMKFGTSLTEVLSNNHETLSMCKRWNRKDEIEKLLTAKVIQGCRSSWSALIIVVPKRDGRKHLVIDYWALNKVTRKFIWPMPKAEDIFSQLNGTKYFSTLDLRAGYYHIPLDEETIPKTAFTSLFGKFEYVKVPFGLAQAPAYFQELMTGKLKDFNFVIAYLNNIIIFGKTVEEHLDHIKQVFKKLWSAHLSIKLSKCHIFIKEIQYLGHTPSTKEIKPLPSKTMTIQNMHPLKHQSKFMHSWDS